MYERFRRTSTVFKYNFKLYKTLNQSEFNSVSTAFLDARQLHVFVFWK